MVYFCALRCVTHKNTDEIIRNLVLRINPGMRTSNDSIYAMTIIQKYKFFMQNHKMISILHLHQFVPDGKFNKTYKGFAAGFFIDMLAVGIHGAAADEELLRNIVA